MAKQDTNSETVAGTSSAGGAAAALPAPRLLIMAASIVFILWGVSQAQVFLVSFLVSVFFAMLAAPVVFWLENKRLPTALAVAIVVLVMVIVLAGAGAVIGASISQFSEKLPTYQTQIEGRIAEITAYLAGKHIIPANTQLAKIVDPGELMGLTAGLLAKVGAAFTNMILIIVTVAFILLEVGSFPGKLRVALGHPRQTFPEYADFAGEMQRYMVVKTMIALATGILTAAWLAAFQIDFPILWGFLAFLLNYVPTLGSTIAGLPAVLLSLLQLGPGWTVLVVAGLGVINFGLDWGVEQRLIGRTVGLSTLSVFLSLLFWGALLGAIGAVLCIPLTISAKFAFDRNPDTQWIAVLLGPATPGGKEAAQRKS